MKSYAEFLNEDEYYWGSNKQPYYRPGPNPTSDMIVVQNNKILLVRRGKDARAEPGKWSIPGGFINTSSKKGEGFVFDIETPKQAALRELNEETNLDIEYLENKMIKVGIYEKNRRDCRDNDISWSKSYAFIIELDSDIDTSKMYGRDDVDTVDWFTKQQIDEMDIAFDHKKIINDGVKLI